MSKDAELHTVLMSSLIPLALDAAVEGPSARIAANSMFSFVEFDDDLGVSLDVRRFRWCIQLCMTGLWKAS
jgi:hypothetical protein